MDPTFAMQQIREAASSLKNYVELNNNLPPNVSVNGITISNAQFLELLMTATIQLNSGNVNPIPLRIYNAPSNPIDDIRAGNILKSEYLNIANDLKIYMDSTGRTPDYQYDTSLGVHLGFQNLIYMYSKVLDNYGGNLANSVSMEPWRYVSSPTLAKFSIDQIKDAALTVKNYVESYYKLPENVTINGKTINMAQFLELLMGATLQLNSGTSNLLFLKSYTNPNNPVDDIRLGKDSKSEYLKIANDLKTYMDSTGRTPDYQYQTSLGVHLGFKNLIQYVQ